jgi:hypothetical protein
MHLLTSVRVAGVPGVEGAIGAANDIHGVHGVIIAPSLTKEPRDVSESAILFGPS